jgi:hypothetical protein
LMDNLLLGLCDDTFGMQEFSFPISDSQSWKRGS